MRNLYLVSYDISEQKRLYRVHRTMEGYGKSLQYSVFLCLLSGRELALLQAAVEEQIKKDEDRVMFVNLGPEEGAAEDRIVFMGLKKSLPERKALIV